MPWADGKRRADRPDQVRVVSGSISGCTWRQAATTASQQSYLTPLSFDDSRKSSILPPKSIEIKWWVSSSYQLSDGTIPRCHNTCDHIFAILEQSSGVNLIEVSLAPAAPELWGSSVRNYLQSVRSMLVSTKSRSSSLRGALPDGKHGNFTLRSHIPPHKYKPLLYSRKLQVPRLGFLRQWTWVLKWVLRRVVLDRAWCPSATNSTKPLQHLNATSLLHPCTI